MISTNFTETVEYSKKKKKRDCRYFC